jgi:hypothetical protein
MVESTTKRTVSRRARGCAAVSDTARHMRRSRWKRATGGGGGSGDETVVVVVVVRGGVVEARGQTKRSNGAATASRRCDAVTRRESAGVRSEV